MGLKADPVFARTYRHEKAIPQYNIGHAAGLAAIDAALANQPGLVLSGNAYRGVSLNDCIENAYKVAEAIIKRK
jgi:oxygen-dependent protoporphyrinogen oxidase